MEQQTFISCLAWVLPGYAAQNPKQVQLNANEIEDMKGQIMQQENHEGSIIEEQDSLQIFGIDPNHKDKSKYPLAIDELQEDEEQDYLIKPTDALIVAGKEKQFASLQVYIYEQDDSNLFTHQQIMLSSFPLDIAWLKVNLGSLNANQLQKGNYAIVSSFITQIQIWNLDIIQAVQPVITLGGQISHKSKKPKKFTNSSKKYKEGSHTNSVLSLSLNNKNLQILASGSADSTVKIWDLSKYSNIFTAKHHKNGVKKVQWHPQEATVLMSCSEDHSIAILDSRYPDDRVLHQVKTGQSLQSACWNPNNGSQIIYGTQRGEMILIDARINDKILHSQQIHQKTVSDIQIDSKGFCYTCSEDGYVRIWNLNNLPEPIASKKANCGKLFCLQLMQSKDGPIVAIGNQKGQLFIWQTLQNESMKNHWNNI